MKTVTAREFRSSMGAVIATVKETGSPVTVFKNSKPWFVVNPVPGEVDEGLRFLEDQRNDPDAKIYDSPDTLFSALGI